MRVLLLTGYDDKFAPLGELTTPLMRSYASRHGLDFMCQREYPDRYPAYWQKLVDVVEAFRCGYDQVIWIDADQVITNPAKFPYFRPGFQASRDWGEDAGTHDFSMCGFVATKDVQFLFDWVLSRESEYANGEFPDQKPMRKVCELRCIDTPITTLERRVFNAVPIEIHPSVVEPWQPGDFCAHLTMVPIERRVELFHKLNERLAFL